MRPALTSACLFLVSVAIAQAVPSPQPVEEQYHISYWWWVLGVLLAIGIGMIVYVLIKKDPKKDAPR